MDSSVTATYIVTKLARNHLEHLHLAGIQIARAQIAAMTRQITAGGSPHGSGEERAFLPVELTDLDPASYGQNWSGLQLISRGHDVDGKVILVDLIVQGPEWSYRYGNFTFPEHLPEAVKKAIETNPERYIGMGPDQGVTVMNTTRNFDGVSVKIDQEETELDLASLGCRRTKQGDDMSILPLPAIGKRIAQIAEEFEAERVPFENAIHAYWKMAMWISDVVEPFRLESFPISREWMVCPRGMMNSNGISIDIKRMGGSDTPENTAAQQTALELEELSQ